MELREVKIDPEKVVLYEWIGRGDLITEDFTVGTYPEGVHVWMSNNPDSDEWQDGTGVLQVLLHNKGTGKSSEIENTYRSGRNTVGIHEPGTYSLEIKSANTRWIVRIWIEKESPDIFVNLTADAFVDGVDAQQEFLPLGRKWFISGELSAQTSSGTEPLVNKTIRLDEYKEGDWQPISEKQTVSTQKKGTGDELQTIAEYWFEMEPIKKLGAYRYRVWFGGADPYAEAMDFIEIQTIHKAMLEMNTDLQIDEIEKHYPGLIRIVKAGSLVWDGEFTVSGRLYDTLEEPIKGAQVTIRYSDNDGQMWQNLPQGKSVTTDESGSYQVKFGGGQTPVFSKQGLYIIKAVFAGGNYNDVDYRYTESPPLDIDVLISNLSLKIKSYNENPVSFEEFAITCTLIPYYGVPITGPVEVVLYANRNEVGLLEVGKFSGPYLDVITFRINLTSGNYEIDAYLKENDNYTSNRSDSINIKVGN